MLSDLKKVKSHSCFIQVYYNTNLRLDHMGEVNYILSDVIICVHSLKILVIKMKDAFHPKEQDNRCFISFFFILPFIFNVQI